MAYCTKKCLLTFERVWHQCRSAAKHFRTGAELSGHFGTSVMVPKCLGSECRDTVLVSSSVCISQYTTVQCIYTLTFQHHFRRLSVSSALSRRLPHPS